VKRIVETLGKRNLVGRAGALFALYVATAIALSAQTFTTLYSFCPNNNCASGATPSSALVQGTDGNLYGTAFSGGNGGGTVYRITPGGRVRTLYSFAGGLISPLPRLL